MVVSNHALNRMIERNVLCQNIKLNKKQIKKNRKKAMNRISNALDNYFAYSFSTDKTFKYLYSNLLINGYCKKYIIHIDTENLVTVIDRIDFNKEIKKYNVFLKKIGNSVVRDYDVDNVYKTFGDNKFLFVLTPFSKTIKSFSFISVSSDKIINELINGNDPFTGKQLENNHLLNDERIKNALIDMQSRVYKKNNLVSISKDDLNEKEVLLFDSLDVWRKNKTEQLNRKNYVLSDRVLYSLIKSSINKKEDLLKINGIDDDKYSEYSDDLFNIILENKKNA